MPPPKHELEEQLSAAQVGEWLHVDESTVWRWIRARKIWPVYKLGRRITRIPASAVERFLAGQQVTDKP